VLKEQIKKILSKRIIFLELILLFLIAAVSIYLVNTLNPKPCEVDPSKNVTVVIPTMSRLTNEDYKNLLTNSYKVLLRISKLMDSESEYYGKKEVSDTDKIKIIEILEGINKNRNSFNKLLTLYSSKIGLSKDSKTYYYFDENDSLLKASIDNASEAVNTASYAVTKLIEYYETKNEGVLLLAKISHDEANKSIKESQTEIRKMLVSNTSEIYVSDIEKPTNSQTDPVLQSYYDSYKDPFVMQIRTTLDIYLKDPTSLSSLLVEKSVGPENAKEGLDSFSSDYYKGKFVVIDIRNSVAGGKFIDILFLDKPDKVFLVWVYKLEGGEYEMRAIAENPYYTQEKIDYYYKQYPQLFNDRSHSF